MITPTPYSPEMRRACFVAGTLVHTKEGLRPIEQIQVGDYVLSKPESGDGETAYKRVVRTVEKEDCETWFVSWFDPSLHEAAAAKRITQEDYLTAHGNSFVITTPNHPFWVVDSNTEELFYAEDRILQAWRDRSWPCKEWVRADHLAPGMRLMLHDGRIVDLWKAIPAYRTAEPEQVWTPRGSGHQGLLIDLRDHRVSPLVPLAGERVMKNEFWKYVRVNPNDACYRDDPIGSAPESWYRGKVYNLEVEDYHTYFVDTLGVWVHNTNCYDVNLEKIGKVYSSQNGRNKGSE